MKIIFLVLASTAFCAAIPTIPRDYDDKETIPENLPEINNIEDVINEYILQATDNNEYWLFTRSNPITPQIIANGDFLALWASNYDGGKPLKVIAHGWNRDGTSPLNIMLTEAFLEVDDVNIIVVDWSISASGNYVSASLEVPGAARFVGNFLQWLITFGGGNWDNVHLIGYSLGAHLIGNVGREVEGRAVRVTGLDPAGPLWSNSFALNQQSGQYVEVIHTDILLQGITEPIGNADFYPNGGRDQPGCDSSSCNHRRAYEYFASSLRTDHFVGRQCSDLSQAMMNQCTGETLNMGNRILSKRGSGIFALTTGDVWPF